MIICILTCNRPQSLKLLLDSLDSVNATIYIFKDKPENILSENRYKIILNSKKISHVFDTDINLGIVKNMNRVFNFISEKNEPCIVLEDDLYCTEFIENYFNQSTAFFSESENVAQISLYNPTFNPLTEYPFYPLYDGSDNYFIQFPVSSGFIIFPEIAHKYINFKSYSKIVLPNRVEQWGETSWKKYFLTFMMENNLFTVYPRISYTTNMGASGVHTHKNTNHFQTPLIYNYITPRFKIFEKAQAIYNSFFEWMPCPDIKKELGHEIFFDLNGVISPTQFSGSHIFTIRKNNSVKPMYNLNFRPPEMNIIYKNPGKIISLMSHTEYQNSVLPENYHVLMASYHYVFTSRKRQLAWFFNSKMF